MTVNPEQRDVWVSAAVRNVPAHRIPEPEPARPEKSSHAMYVIVCPPGVATGGTILTRAEAAALSAFPCTNCFPLPKPTPAIAPAARGGPR